MTKITYEIRWKPNDFGQRFLGPRTIGVDTEEEARPIFQTCLNHKMPCTMVKIEKTETIEAAFEWREG